MFTSLLLATDGSDCALKAAAVAATLADKFKAPLTLINVFQPRYTAGPYGGTLNAGLDDQYIEETENYALSRAVRILEEANVPYQVRQESGSPAEEIVRVAQEENCDLIVIGSRGQSSLASLLLGSVSDSVTHHAHCPVLIVK